MENDTVSDAQVHHKRRRPFRKSQSRRMSSDAPTLARWNIRDHFYSTGSRTLSVLAALFILVCEMMSSMENKRVLFGTASDTEPYITYWSPYMPEYLTTIVSQPLNVQGILQTLALPNVTSPSVVYLDVPSSPTAGDLRLQPTSCSSPSSVADPIYDSSYLRTLQHHALAQLGEWISTATIIVDCSFDGRLLGDTTVIKVHLLDKTMTNFSTLVVQTLSVSRPEKLFFTTGGVAMLTTTPLDTMHVDPRTGTVSSNLSATYGVTLGFTFPYEWDAFERITLDDLIPQTNGQWQATVDHTGERFVISGSTGTYHNSPTVQANIGYYFWDLPSNPIDYAKSLEVHAVFVRKDARGWFRCCLGLGIGFNIAVNTLVSFVVIVNLWRTSRIIWIPDVFPAIQRRASVRTLLLLVDCVINKWWYPYTHALGQGGYRTNWAGTLFLDNLPRADGLMVCLAVAYGAARLLRIRLKLVFVVGIYALCFYNRMDLVNRYGVCPNQADAIIEADYFGNVVPGNAGGMDLWLYHDDDTVASGVHAALIANEFTWLFIAVGWNLVYALVVKAVFHIIVQKHGRRSLSRRSSTFDHSVSHRTGPSSGFSTLSARIGSEIASITSTTTATRLVQVTPVVPETLLRDPNRVHWTRRSALYDGMTELDMIDNTRVERSVGLVVSHMTGFVASTTDYVVHVDGDKTRTYVSLSGLWLLGFVVVNDRLLVAINDVVFLFLNIVLRRHLFRIYGFALHGDIVARHRHQIFPHDVHLKELSKVSLKILR
ncbi:Aste57867_11912 [Aphanomyces stellatus]|uniref:Aste57867_11912 protein n=1 Tax=Aphanomyces stellatus TaxID=120398 RepID=A0A485KU80_9STRA|nr:hypothetical protein As57867_011867 [Aphanomyces stellatus]VFT88767.1 Aste57867_11912 [Aphanomyces stellatus]